MITDPFFKILYSRLAEEVQNRTTALTTGGSLVHTNDGLLLDPINTALKYKADVVYLQALHAVIELGVEIERGIYSHKSDSGDD